MKALSVRQPWAWAIIHAGKDIENRTWATKYRGPLLIHASAGTSFSEWTEFAEFYLTLRSADPTLPELPPLHQLDRGGIVGRARLVDMVREERRPWFFGPVGWLLTEAEPLPFKAAKGRLGLFEVEI